MLSATDPGGGAYTPLMNRVRRYHFHLPGLLFAAVTLLLGIGAINSQNNLLFLLFGLGVGSYVVSGFVSGLMMMRIDVRRVGRSEAESGGRVRIGYEVRCTGRWIGAFALTIEEVRPRKKWWFRRSQASGWDGRMREVVACVTHVGAGRSVRTTGRGDALRRGVCELGAVRVSSRFPFGLMQKSVTVRSPGRVIIRPAVVGLVGGLIEGCVRDDRFASGSGSTPQRVGDFFGLRDYVPGDSPRTIAWRASARAGELVVRECANPVRTAVWVVLSIENDTQNHQQDDPERAISLAASLVMQGDALGIDVGLSVPGYGIGFLPASGRGHTAGILDSLGELDIAHRADVHLAAPNPGVHDTVILVRSGDPDDGYTGQARLVFRGSDLDRLTVGNTAGRTS